MEDDRQQIRKAFRIHGYVQGVGFRWWTRQQAERLGLAGTVRNCRDGTVEVTLAGPADAVEEMRRRLERGPPGAHVDRVTELPSPDQELVGFRIVR